MKKSESFERMTEEEFDNYLLDFMGSVDDLDLYYGQIDVKLNNGVKAKYLYSEANGVAGIVYYTRDAEDYYTIWE